MKKGTAYFGNRYINHFKEDIKDVKAAGCSIILHTFPEYDMKFYLDTVKELVGVSKENGLEVYVNPWGVGKVFGGEGFSDFLTNNIEDMEVIENGEKRGIACLYSENFRKFIRSWIDAAVYVGADVIFIDEPHWYIAGWFNEKDHWGCRCERCKKRFRNEYGYEMPVEINDDILTFKMEGILDFMKFMSSYAREKDVKTAVCLLPSDKKRDLELYEKTASLNTVDILGTDPYWIWDNFSIDFREYVGKYTSMIKNLSNKYNKESEIWIQNFRVTQDREDEVREALEIIKSYDIDRVLSWGYRGSCVMSSLACSNPDNIWDMFRKFK